MPEKVVRLKWNPKQSELFRTTETFVDFEGAVRAGKTKPAIWYVIDSCLRHPGIKWMICRWTDGGLAQLKPQFYENCPKEVLGPPPGSGREGTGWHGKEEYQEFKNGSVVYIRSLRTAEDALRYSKLSGLTLSGVFIDQAEELPEDVWEAVKARLSQPGYPHKLIVTPNPPALNHWITKEFPTDNSKQDHRYILTSVYDNAANIGWEYIGRLEREYPPGHAMRRRWIDGARGLSLEGEPVYGEIFKRGIHISDEIELLPDYPLIESWDFGQKHPAVLWSQLLPWGEWRILGEKLGQSQYLEDFVNEVAIMRSKLFPNHTDLMVCCDPSGADRNNQGMRYTAVEILNMHLRDTYGDEHLGATFIKGSNRPERREWAIQQIAGYMLRLTKHGPALRVHPRCKVLIDGFEGGYVYDKERSTQNSTIPNIRRPKKGGYYDHLQNTAEYTHLNFGSGQLNEREIQKRLHRRLKQAQRDVDAYERPRNPVVGRGGY